MAEYTGIDGFASHPTLEGNGAAQAALQPVVVPQNVGHGKGLSVIVANTACTHVVSILF